MKLRQTATHVVLALLLLLSQQLGIAHAVSHLTTQSTSGVAQQKQLPPELQCDQCLAFAAIGSAVNAAPHAFFIGLAANPFEVGLAPFRLLPPTIRAFDSRAPPVVVR
ncbi:hypothetical protein [Noviherbaspirillum autotrophicum]|uniref:DUF2946 domain-containing protein n=1 Tax=Noviherbaspirillum autotrophicum TaxID=709839 RepID=A0A0C2BKT6_9BURK|nr:hypothetical protein [Noviherbaspirillum autotrophicum]KIF81850.1 hypothetical protein TSA66_15270 [Noviherbaspirillum autotrophicum]